VTTTSQVVNFPEPSLANVRSLRLSSSRSFSSTNAYASIAAS